jgi:hypothetical protein
MAVRSVMLSVGSSSVEASQKPGLEAASVKAQCSARNAGTIRDNPALRLSFYMECLAFLSLVRTDDSPSARRAALLPALSSVCGTMTGSHQCGSCLLGAT